jgi:uncharacterized protein
MTDAPSGVVRGADGRAKAYRPLPAAERAAAFQAGIEAYARGDFFEAHELLEPAWMGTADPADRDLHQGLIKLAAAYVHGVRGNPLGMRKNLVGARERLASAATDTGLDTRDLDLAALVAGIDARLAVLDRDPSTIPSPFDPPALPWRSR